MTALKFVVCLAFQIDLLQIVAIQLKGVAYFARITPLKFDDLSETIAETFKAYDRYRQYRREQENDE